MQLWGCGGHPQGSPGVGSRLLVPGWAVMGLLKAGLGWAPLQPYPAEHSSCSGYESAS